MSDMKLNPETLLAWAAGELPAAEACSVEAALAGAPELARRASRFRRVVELMRSDDSLPVPASLLAEAKALFAGRKAAVAAPGWLESLKRVVAALVYDSRPRAALAGLRSAASESFQLSFESEHADVDVQFDALPLDAGDPPRWRMLAQVTPRGDAAVESAVLVNAGTLDAVAQAAADETGLIRIDVSGGRFDLLVAVGGNLIVIPGVSPE
ncbi:MAG: hypothetical protein IPM64_13535 [Phycisphaerales bacterium]|nr:hypothetical protein [Phycisphaerales bacterium]